MWQVTYIQMGLQNDTKVKVVIFPTKKDAQAFVGKMYWNAHTAVISKVKK